MHERQFSPLEFAIFAGTRVALGIGIGLLLSGRLGRDQRKGAGIALLAVGASSTVPFIVNAIIRKARHQKEWEHAA
ncbi:MAG TPA: hypothetical protein VN577_13390 [Terriglobales bacterium]|nr:hypothetical protein [Terriglobales bacterium]